MPRERMQCVPLPRSSERPLCVDLDGTLVCTDLLVEAVFALFKENLLYLFLLPLWLFRGKAHLKHQIAERVDLDASLLPYHGPFLDYLKQEHATGRRLILATASNIKFAEAIASYLKLFDTVLASDAKTNLSGQRKLDRLQNQFGEGQFDYAGNAKEDLVIWTHADEAILVNPERRLRTIAERQLNIAHIFENKHNQRFKRLLEAMRLHQWLKNLLVFVPLVMAHRAGEPLLLGQVMLAFLSFGLCASSVYLLNDLLDLTADRQHPTKRNRPFAAGSISIVHGTALIPGLLLAAVSLALLLPLEFLGVLALYYVTTLAYSLRLKRAALIDVLVLAGLYTLRIIAGAAAVLLVPSFWLLAFSMFLFLSLAMAKRYTELLLLNQHRLNRAAGRGYRAVDQETLAHFGIASAYMAVLVLAFYINSDMVRTQYTQPEIIWLLCPLLLYLVGRIWLLARRNELHEDPVLFVIADRRSQLLAGLGAFLLWLAI